MKTTGREASVEETLQQNFPAVLYLVGQDSHQSDVQVPPWWRQEHDGQRCYMMSFGRLENVKRQMSGRTLDEAWDLEASVTEDDVAQFLLEFIAGRGIDLVEIATSRLALDLIPTAKMAFPHLKFVVDLSTDTRPRWDDCSYVTSRYGNLVDAYVTDKADVVARLQAQYIPTSKIHAAPPLVASGDLGVFSDELYLTLMGGRSAELCSDGVAPRSRT